MEARKSIVDQFSTFISWKDGQSGQWLSDHRLRRRMVGYWQEDSSLLSSQYWVLFWHQRYLEDSQSDSPPSASPGRNHLYAYLQEPCYRAAADLWRTYSQYLDPAIADYFDIGILKFDKILAGFNAELNPNLYAHGLMMLKWRITDELRQVDKTLGQTLWSLLLDTSETRLRKALMPINLSEQMLERYLSAWDCYKTIYKTAKIKRDGKLEAPDQALWERITAAYHQQSGGQEESRCLQKWLLECGEALRRDLSPQTISLNRKVGGDRQTELIDVLPLEFQEDTTEAQAQQASLEAKFQVIYTWLQQELDALDIKAHRLNPHSKQMLEMYYGQGLKQTPIAVALNLNQGTVARTLAKIQAILAGRFIEWLAENSMPSLESHDIQTLGDALEQWLHYLYQHPTSMTEEH